MPDYLPLYPQMCYSALAKRITKKQLTALHTLAHLETPCGLFWNIHSQSNGDSTGPHGSHAASPHSFHINTKTNVSTRRTENIQ